MKIVTYNVNGIRAALRKGLDEWLKKKKFDIVCFQETKAWPEQVDVEIFEKMGYHHHWVQAEKKGYSGCLTISKKEPTLVKTGCGYKKHDSEGRVLRTDFGDWTLLNCYFPSGSAGPHRQEVKMEFLRDFGKFVKKLKKTRPNLVIVGDYNIANHPIDIHNPVSNKKTPGFLPDERAWLTKWFETGMNDSFRTLHPEKIEYSWWSLRTNARASNKGWRIDYQAVSDSLVDKLKKAKHLSDAVHSDHCPMLLEIDL